MIHSVTPPKLDIFESFHCDWTLPKFAAPSQDPEDDAQDSDQSVPQMRRVSRAMTPTVFSASSTNGSWLVQAAEMTMKAAPSRFARLWRQKPKPEPEPTLTIEEFFHSIKDSAASNSISILKDYATAYEKALQRAKLSGQIALGEQLAKSLSAARAEAQLVAMGLTKFLTEAPVVEFASKAKRGLRLDYVTNFTRFIPDEIVARKVEADERGIFDNYCVLHYDPERTAVAETKAEVDARKDPILFGLIEGRRRLYFVGDWKDEFCDLTLEEIVASGVAVGSIGPALS